MKEIGRLRTCDRCGATCFEKYIETQEMDGGYTTRDKYEVAEGWGSNSEFNDLCPECMEKWNKIVHDFTIIDGKKEN